MKLTDLQATFVRRITDNLIKVEGVMFADAEGVQFLCPKCFKANGNSDVGTHWVMCWFMGVPQTIRPTPGRWNKSGSSLDDLTFVPPGATSVQLNGGCNAHFWVEYGAIRE